MKRGLSQRTKAIRKMGQGTGKDYKPYIRVKEFNSRGTTSIIQDWKTKRSVECMSQGEMMWYYILRWDDDNVDIREQFPLDSKITHEIADAAGIKYPRDRPVKKRQKVEEHVMTTDFLVTRADGSKHAYSVKPSRDLSERTMQLLFIEKMYWKRENVNFTILYTSDVNKTLAHNIRVVVEFYDPERVFDDKYSAIKHLIATKRIKVDLETQELTCAVYDYYANLLKEENA